MDRSLYPDGVEVNQTDLSNSEEQRSFHILKRNTSVSSTGVVYGLLTTQNGIFIDISSGYGYAPNGELVELLSPITNAQLSNYANGTKNYVLLIYTESNDKLKPHETNGESIPTRANRSYRLAIYTETDYNALPDTDDNLNNDAKDRALVVAIVTAQGVGISLTSSNIEIPSAFSGGTSATIQGVLSGVDIIRINSDTPSGIGSIEFTVIGKLLVWIAPGDSSGTSVDISAGGVFILTSQPSGLTLTVLISNALLPVTDTVVSVTVTNIYKQSILRNTALDIQHRSFIGSGIPKPNNPHGLTPGDLGLGETQTEFHQQVFHSNAITTNSSPTFLEPSINTGAVPHKIDLVAPIAGDSVYIGGFPHNQINGTNILFADVVDDVNVLFDVFAVVGTGNFITSFDKYERIRYLDAPPPPISAVAQLRDISDSVPAGAALLRWDGANLQFQAPGDSFGAAVAVQVSPTAQTIRLFSSTEDYWIDLYVRDISFWGAIVIVDEDLVISTPPTLSEWDDRFLISRTLFTGSGTGFLGNGFGSANSPNDPNDKRIFGLTGNNRISSDVGKFQIRTIDNINVSNFSQLPIQMKSYAALPPGPYGEAGVLGVQGTNLYFWDGTSWNLVV